MQILLESRDLLKAGKLQGLGSHAHTRAPKGFAHAVSHAASILTKPWESPVDSLEEETWHPRKPQGRGYQDIKWEQAFLIPLCLLISLVAKTQELGSAGDSGKMVTGYQQNCLLMKIIRDRVAF